MKELGRYTTHHVLGRGGTATVYFGTRRGPSGFVRRVAVKQLHQQLANDKQTATLLADEARIAGRVSHANTVPVVDVIEQGGEIFVVMDYVHGASLSELLGVAKKKSGPWNKVVPPEIAVAVMADALSGLAAAHAARDSNGQSLGLVHRDISPDNVMIGVDGAARLADFGIARAKGRMVTTESGVVKGKFRYMAPEQAAGDASQSSDLFSMGILLWELLAGKRLFDAENEAAVFNQVLNKPIPAPSSHNPNAEPALEAIAMRALERNPKARFSSAAEMCDALSNAHACADRRRVSAWMEGLVGDSLAQKLALVEEAERELESAPPFVSESTPSLTDEAAPTLPNSSRTSLGMGPISGTNVGLGSLKFTPRPSSSAHAVAPISAPASAPAMPMPETTRLTSSLEQTAPELPQRRNHATMIAIAIAAFFGVASLALVVKYIVLPAPVEAGRSNDPIARPGEIPTSPPAVWVGPTATPTSTAAVTAPPIVTAPTATTTIATVAPSSLPSARPIVKPRGASAPDCRVPYVIASDGTHEYRRECLQ